MTAAEQAIAKLQAAQGDPRKLALATLDIVLSGYPPELREALEAAAIPHWFTKDILAKLLNVHDDQAAAYFEQLQRLPMVEPFPARDAWNVHEATRLALRSELAATQLTKLRKLSTLAVPCFKGDEPHQRIERLYHELVSDPSQAGSALSALRQEWEDKEELLALGPLLLELGNEGLLDDEIEFQSELARFYGALGDAARSFGQSQQALAYFEHAKGTFERLAQVEPSRPVLQRDLSVSYERLGDLARALGQIEPARAYFQESSLSANPSPKPNPTNPTSSVTFPFPTASSAISPETSAKSK
jgi:tetratricopeptide (TPR) repeat protein